MLALRGIICIWTFAVLARTQGSLGGQQYPPCNRSISQGSQYIGCYDLSNEVLELQITGTDPTLYSYYPSWIETNDPTAAGLFDNSVDPANCTVACRGHGYKYAALYGGSVCRCMGNPPSTLAPRSSTNPLDPLTSNSCHAPGQFIPGNCPGDSSQFCGTGNYADVYVDNSFPLLSTISPTVEQNHYSYIGCFHPGSGANANVGLLSYRVPAANVTGATSLTPCFEFCASLGFPLVEFDGGNSYSSCLCGSEISHGYQQLDSSCKGDCIGGSTCAGGDGCCGQRRSNTIYENSNLVGCYEPPIPSASFVAGGPQQTYSEPTSGPTMVGHTLTTATYTGPYVVTTNPPSVPAFKIKYHNLGCWQRTSANSPIISGPYGPYIDNTFMTVNNCLNTCDLVGYSYASLTNETASGFTCRCGNSFGSNAGQQPAASCHQLCPGNSPPQTYDYCGGVAVNEQIFGPLSSATTVTTTAATTTATTIATTSSTVSQTLSVTSSSTSSTSSSGLDCQADNCLRQFEASTAVTAFCQTYTTAIQTASTGLPPYVSQCSGIPSRVSSACSCVVTGPPAFPTSSTTITGSTASSATTTSLGTTVTSIATSTSGPTSIIASTNSGTTSTTTATAAITTPGTTSSGSAQTSAGLDCQPDNCLRQFRQSPSVTAFCATYTTDLQTATTGLPPFVSQCSGVPSRVSSACSCAVTGNNSPSSISTSFPTTFQVSSATGTSTVGTSITTTNTPLPPPQGCSPDNCYRQFQQSSAVTPFCATYTTALQTDTTGLPPYVSQCQSMPSRISSACSCLVPGSLLSTTSGTTSSSTSTNSFTTTSVIVSTIISSTSTSTPTNTLPSPPQNCSPDNCYRQFQQSPAVTPFCATYTASLQTATTSLPPFVSQCQSLPSRISSACSCLVPGSSPGVTSTITATESITTSGTIISTGTSSSALTPSTLIVTTTTPPPPPPENCSPDNCYRQFQQSPAVTPFCASYTASLQTASTGLPPFVSQCQSLPSRISSACSCLVTGSSSPSTTSDTQTTGPINTISSTETQNPTGTTSPTSSANPPPPQNCSPDNCYRQFVQSSAVTPFCESYTTALETATTGLPPFVSQCAGNPSRISSACSCVVTSSTLPSFTTNTESSISTELTSLTGTASVTGTPTTTSGSTGPSQNCSPDNCLRQFEQSPAVTPFCVTYTATLQTASTGLPTFVSQCQSKASRISSACSCIVPPAMPTSLSGLSTSETGGQASSTSTVISTPPAQNCSPDNCLRQFSQSLSEVSTFCSTYTTAIQTETTGLPPFVSQCSSLTSRVSSACSCIAPPPTSPPITSEIIQTASSSGNPSATSICVPGYNEDCQSLSLSLTSATHSAVATTSIGIASPSTTSSSTPPPTNTAGVPSIFGIQPGNSGYYKKRQSYQSYVGPGGAATVDCTAAVVYNIINGELFVNGQTISTNPGTLYEPLSVISGPTGTITTVFAVDGNGFLTWQNSDFTNGEAYFCEQDIQIYALLNGLDNPGYPEDCVLVSLLAIPATNCQNGVIISPSSQPTQGSAAPTSGTIGATGSAGQPTTTLGSLTTTASIGGATSIPSGGIGSSSLTLPPNVYSTPQSGLVCVTTLPTLGDSGLTFEPMPTYMRREVQ